MARLISDVVAKSQDKIPPPLHELETLVMDEVWRQGQATVRDVLTALNRGSKQRAYTTVMTIMSRLHEKGLLSRERKGKSDLYRPVIGRDEYLDARARAETLALVDEYGDVALAMRSALREIREQRGVLRALDPVQATELAGHSVMVFTHARPQAFCAGLLRPRICVSTAALERLSRVELGAVIVHEAHHQV